MPVFVEEGGAAGDVATVGALPAGHVAWQGPTVQVVPAALPQSASQWTREGEGWTYRWKWT